MKASVLLLAAIALAASALCAGAASGQGLLMRASNHAQNGGTLRVNISGTDVSSLDPALTYDFAGWQIEFATCAKLLNFPDRSGRAGVRLVPEVAAHFPTISADGRTYRFTVRHGFRFNTGEPVTAASFAHAINRDLSPRIVSPGLKFVKEIVGADAVMHGRRNAASGVTIRGDTLIIRLRKPVPAFALATALPFFCAVSRHLASDPRGVDTPPGAGPYYVASRTPGQYIVLKRNPFYRGRRPHHLDQIVFTVDTNLAQSFLQVSKGEADYDASGLPPTVHGQMAQQFGINKKRYFVHPSLLVQYLALNTSRPLYRSARARRAVNFALDRAALLSLYGPLAGRPTDQILPWAMPGYRDARIYPLSHPDLERARALLDHRRRNANLWVPSDPTAANVAQLIQVELRRVGVDVRIRVLPFATLMGLAGVRGASFDMLLFGWFPDYPDPYGFINSMLSGHTIAARNNVNFSYFKNPSWDRRMDAAARLRGAARYRAYGKLDVNLMREAAPLAPIYYGNVREFVSSSVGCYVFQPALGAMDLAASCLR
jgi:peptide/nickel transport system substrate-binding protein